MFRFNKLEVDTFDALPENGFMFGIGDALKKIREERKLTQGEVAAKAKMRPNTLGDLEHNNKLSRIETLEKAAKGLDMTVPEIYLKLDELRGLTPATSAPVLDSSPFVCANKTHRNLHKLLDEILDAPEEEWKLGIIANLKAMRDKAVPSGTTTPERKYGADAGGMVSAKTGKRLGRR